MCLLLSRHEHDPDRGTSRQAVGCRGDRGTHDEAWRAPTRASSPVPNSSKLINRRGPEWWDSAIRKGSRIGVLAFGDASPATPITGATAPAACTMTARSTSSICGRNTRAWASAAGCSPPPAVTWCRAGMHSLVIWALSDNEPAVEILPGVRRQARWRARPSGSAARVARKVAFAWNAEPELSGDRSRSNRPVSATQAGERARPPARVLASRQAMVIGPTPPGTGVIAPATSPTSAKATSPTMRALPPAPRARD